jgi:hypothetical protein
MKYLLLSFLVAFLVSCEGVNSNEYTSKDLVGVWVSPDMALFIPEVVEENIFGSIYIQEKELSPFKGSYANNEFKFVINQKLKDTVDVMFIGKLRGEEIVGSLDGVIVDYGAKTIYENKQIIFKKDDIENFF